MSTVSRRNRILLGALALPALSLGLAACGGGGGGGGGSSTTTSANATSGGSGGSGSGSSGSATTIVIKDFSFVPPMDKVKPGTTITVKNEDPTTHTLTSTSNPRAFNTGDISANSTKTFTAPSKPGSYPYICLIHQYMHGTLVVS